MAIPLQNFINVAKNNNVVIHQKQTGNIEFKSGFFKGKNFLLFNARNQNQQTRVQFLNALKIEYGADTASYLASTLDSSSGKPLSGRVISNTISDANAYAIKTQMKAFNAIAVNDFIASGQTEYVEAYAKVYLGQTYLLVKAMINANEEHCDFLGTEKARGQDLATLLKEAAENCNHQLTHSEIKKIAKEIINKQVLKKERIIITDFNTQAVTDFLKKPEQSDEVQALIEANKEHCEWLGSKKAGGQDIATLLKNATRNCQHQLTHQDITYEAQKITNKQAILKLNTQAVTEFMNCNYTELNPKQAQENSISFLWSHPKTYLGKMFATQLAIPQDIAAEAYNKLTQSDIMTIVKTTFEEIQEGVKLYKKIKDNFSPINKVFSDESHIGVKGNFSNIKTIDSTKNHTLVLKALDKCAKHIFQLAQLELANKTQLQLGADDKQDYQEKIAAEIIRDISADKASLLLNRILNHPTSKELTQLLSSPSFKMQLMEDLEKSGVPNKDQIVVLTKLCRTEALLSALISELDKKSHGGELASERTNYWFDLYCMGDGAGEISASNPDFTKAFLAMQKKDNGVDLSSCGLANITPNQYPKKYISLNDQSAINKALEEIANKADDEYQRTFVRDFPRSVFIVDNVQISKNNNLEDNNIDLMPSIAKCFANQALFADIVIALNQQENVLLATDHDSPCTYIMNTNKDKSVQLTIRATFDLNAMLTMPDQGDIIDLKLDNSKSYFYSEVNLVINEQENGQVQAKLTDPVTIDYRAVPAQVPVNE